LIVLLGFTFKNAKRLLSNTIDFTKKADAMAFFAIAWEIDPVASTLQIRV
jgi:hypothetical protein